jgi:hypothetical protein
MIRLAVGGVVLLFVFFLLPAYFAASPAQYWLHQFPDQVQGVAQQAADWAHTIGSQS